MTLVRNEPTSELRALVTKLGGTWSGTTAMCVCPAHSDRTPSLAIRQGDRGILVTCHAGCDPSDVLRELSRIQKLPDFSHSTIVAEKPRRGTPHLSIWRDATAIAGTLAERYIRETRNIWCPLNDVRFHPRCPLGKAPNTTFGPALIVAMRKDRAIQAIQRIFVDPDTANYIQKVVLGISIGAAWSNGEPATVIGLCEGFETAAAYTSLTGIQAWSTMGAKRFHQLTIPQTTKTLVLLADNDPEGRRARDRAEEQYQRPGLIIETEWPPAKMNDWAQLLKR